jgi:hypothetical protein
MMRITLAIVVAIVVSIAIAPAHASLIVYGSHSDFAPAPGGSLSDVRMLVDMTVTGGVATMTFTNVSTGMETSAVFKEIVIDTYVNDTNTAILWNGKVLSGSYTMADSNGLPGFAAYTHETPPLISLLALSPAPKKGIGPGSSFAVEFQTSLADGSTINDYLGAFGGQDTSNGALGFQAISADVVNGQSLSGINQRNPVPEPSLMALLTLGGAGAVVMRRGARRHGIAANA